jgi:hypothetical protein
VNSTSFRLSDPDNRAQVSDLGNFANQAHRLTPRVRRQVFYCAFTTALRSFNPFFVCSWDYFQGTPLMSNLTPQKFLAAAERELVWEPFRKMVFD